MNSVLISVIIPTFNNGAKIIAPINCVKRQLQPENTKVTYEIIVIDDASEEKYFMEVEKVAATEESVKLIRCEKNGGPSVARNVGMKQAKGDFITFLDSDDLWPENKIKLLMPLFSDSNVEVAGGKVEFQIKEGIEFNLDQWEDDQQRVTHVHLGALIVRQSIINRGYYFDENLRYSEDIDWWSRIREDNIGISIIEDTTLIYLIHGENMTFNNSHELKKSLLMVIHKSLKRRKEKGLDSKIPQIRDFRKNREDLLISVIVPLYNGLDLIGKAIQSIMNQTYKNIEIILVDDGSTDNGVDWVNINFPAVTVIQQRNKGISAARNAGVKISKGDIIAFLDHDDVWLPEKLEKQLTVLKEDPYCGWVTCNQQILWGENVERPKFYKSELDKPRRSLVPSSFLIRKHILLSMNGFNETLKMREDLDLIRKLRNHKIKESNIDEILLEKWYSGKNMTYNIEQAKADMFAVLRKQIKKDE